MKTTMIVLLMGLMLTGCATHKSGRVIEGDRSLDVSTIGEGILIDNNDQYPQQGNRDLFQAVMFAFDSAQVSPDEAGKCEQVAKHLRRKGGGVILEGHADEQGSREYNQALGEVRSLAVRDYLVELGVDVVVIQTKSFGEEMPASVGHDEGAWSQNRRVVFAIY